MGLICLAFATPDEATAAQGAFTDTASFDAALSGAPTLIDFESLANGADVTGTTQTVGPASVMLPGTLTDVLDPAGPALSLRIVSDPVNNPAVSGTKSLGVEDAKNFHAITAGTALTFAFPDPVLGFGLMVVTPEEPGLALFDGDLLLSVPGEPTAILSLADAQVLGAFGGRDYRAYFLGVVGDQPFAEARLEVGGATPTSTFLFNVDDLRVDVPEPSGSSLWLACAAWLQILHSRRKTTRFSSLNEHHPANTEGRSC